MFFRYKRHVSTTTWPDRHGATFGELRNYLRQNNISTPLVLEVGPGATTQVLRDYLAAGEGKDLSWFKNRYRSFLRNVDGALRRIPSMPLCSYEPGELETYLPEGSRQIVTDISPSVIQAIEKQYPRIEARVFDFSLAPYETQVDIIVCLCVLVRAQEPEKIFSNLYSSLKSGGLMVMDSRSRTSFASPHHTLEKITSQIWRKI